MKQRTTLTNLPSELVQSIFNNLDPTQALKFRRLCKYIHRCVSDPFFIWTNMIRFVDVTEIMHQSKNRLWLNGTLSPYNINWFQWPETHQCIYAYTRFRNVQRILWSGCGILGSIPSAIGFLDQLQWLDLENNGLEGPIPREIGCLVNLVEFTVSRNRLTGSIPNEIGYLVKLKVLSVHHNELSGGIPDEIGLCVELEYLAAGFNALTGSIPATIGHLQKLQVLALENNQLNGSIPREISNLVSLCYLTLEMNCFVGTIPRQELDSLKRLRVVLLDGNQFSNV
ncbi:L domain-like protein [Rhizoclosmatium globosum]|uniref:L domain-like protein n=1 Tax=Rhizoclosmatium globosum TaxID=329046 RepID=A0A1Y2B844_9FUNG|nr:L domain-like protein [Rhizoclosmatium globosum]|eukprot:ORY30700.1 L domain-like protein [Rhizoclosmatium globosum]